MTSGAPDRAATRRHLLIIGVANYQPGWGQIGPAVEAEVEKARSLFLDVLKFEPTTVHRITDTTETGIKQGVAAE